MPPDGVTTRTSGSSSSGSSGLRLLAGLLLDLLRGLLAAGPVPLVVVVAGGAVLHRLVEVLRVECHRVLGLDLVDRQPPVELLLRSREPGVAMRVELVARGRRSGTRRAPSCAAAGRRSRSVEVATEFREHARDQLLARGWWMNAGLSSARISDVSLRRHVSWATVGSWGANASSLSSRASSQSASRSRRQRRRTVAAVQTVAALLLVQRGVEIDRRQGGSSTVRNSAYWPFSPFKRVSAPQPSGRAGQIRAALRDSGRKPRAPQPLIR